MSFLRSRSIALGCAGLALLLTSTAPLAAHEPEGGGPGVGKGVDHVAVLVRPESFSAAVAAFREELGFATTPALASPVGAKNSLVWFENLGYLEILTFTKLNEFTAPFLAFLEQHEGGKFYGSDVVDAAGALSFLNANGYPAVGPIPAAPLVIEETGQVLGLTPLWGSIVLTTTLAPDNSLFFLDYDEAQVQQMFVEAPAVAPRPHPNTARRIEALWQVVTDLDAAIAFYEGLGFEVRGRHRPVRYLGARSATVRFPDSELVLLVPDGAGPVADFVAERGEGLFGASLKVGSLRTARALIEANTGLELETFRFRGERRLLLPPTLTRGFRLELVE